MEGHNKRTCVDNLSPCDRKFIANKCAERNKFSNEYSSDICDFRGVMVSKHNLDVKSCAELEEKLFFAMESKPKSGDVYIMKNPHFKEGLLQLGSSTDLERRRKQLSRESGVFGCNFKVVGSKKFPNVRAAKCLCCGVLDSKRVQPNREHFMVDEETARSVLEQIAFLQRKVL
mmetsp:Transcript_31775/g.45760  ORF Transcript_31775/g.45760 Transcript_31775/m.45760 type:complete len:173 (+) Transcript_31775:340-858(+)